MNTDTEEKTIAPQSTMQQVLEAYPGARRALFRRYHIGGCSSCGFQPDETVEQVCRRNDNLNIDEVIEHIRASHELDSRILLAPRDLAALREQNPNLRLLDVRTREEHEAVHIEGSVLMSQTTMQEILTKWPRAEMFVIYDHTGKQALDATAYYIGHGFANVRCLRGGIDAWSQEIDPALPRYKLE